MSLTLQELSNACGVSVGYLSQVERDNAVPTLGTLAEIVAPGRTSMLSPRGSLRSLGEVTDEALVARVVRGPEQLVDDEADAAGLRREHPPEVGDRRGIDVVHAAIEIEAVDSGGFDENKIRTVSENAKTLKFDQSGFEKE